MGFREDSRKLSERHHRGPTRRGGEATGRKPQERLIRQGQEVACDAEAPPKRGFRRARIAGAAPTPIAACQSSSPRGRRRKKPPIPKDWRPAGCARRSFAMQQRKGPAKRDAQLSYQDFKWQTTEHPAIAGRGQIFRGSCLQASPRGAGAAFVCEPSETLALVGGRPNAGVPAGNQRQVG